MDSAVSITKKYARQARLDVVSKLVERMSQEVLVKQETNAWAVALNALANASTSSVTASSVGITGLKAGSHVIPAATESTFQLADLNKLMTLNKRINQSWAGGTPDAAYSAGITDLYVSPEVKEQVRAFAYQPMNTRHGAVTSSGASSVALPDSVRSEIYNNAGTSEIFGVNIVELNELGVGQKYNTLFDEFDSGNVGPHSSAGTADSFTGSDDELLVGVDNSKGAFVRALAQNSDSGASFTAQPDDQYVQRQEKLGFYGALEEGRVCIDSRAVVGLVI